MPKVLIDEGSVVVVVLVVVVVVTGVIYIGGLLGASRRFRFSLDSRSDPRSILALFSLDSRPILARFSGWIYIISLIGRRSTAKSKSTAK